MMLSLVTVGALTPPCVGVQARLSMQHAPPLRPIVLHQPRHRLRMLAAPEDDGEEEGDVAATATPAAIGKELRIDEDASGLGVVALLGAGARVRPLAPLAPARLLL